MNCRWLQRCVWLAAVLAIVGRGAFVTGAEVAPPASDEAGEAFFERKIRPLLVQHCYSCHARGQSKGGLRLDSRAALLAGGEGGAVIALGKPAESSLIEAVEYRGGLNMPPNGPLAAEEVAALRQWILIGAPWPADPAGDETSGSSLRSGGQVTAADRQFWSFQPVRDHQPPTVQQAGWVRQPLDAFILARLESEGLPPVEPADRATLIRRATFDLLGLPPTFEEVEAFVNDPREDAYERLIDRLLDSPHYGERWARHWLDVARYGEDQAHTFQARLYPSGFRYRDWVVDAFNRDLPFDRFVLEQVAGDLLDDPAQSEAERIEARRRRSAALGFFALGPVYYGDAGCAPRARMDEFDDRIDTLSRGFLGLTVSCARCHDHKFDPIPTTDFYALAGVFASSQYIEAPLAPREVVERYDAAQAEIKKLDQQLKDAQAKSARELGESYGKQTAAMLVTVWKFNQARRAGAKVNLTQMAKEAGLDELVVGRWQQHLDADRAGKHPMLAPWRELVEKQDESRDLSADPAVVAEVERVAREIESVVQQAIEARQGIEQKHEAALAALKPGDKAPNKPGVDKQSADVLKYIVDDRGAPLQLPKDQVEKRLSAEQRERLASYQPRIDALKKDAGEKYPIAHSLIDGTATNIQVHHRGNHKDLGDEVPRHFLTILSAGEPTPFSQGSGRLELARSIASPDNPLTARVFVNRVWQHHFGRGLVGTPSNFGLLGERPSHPELLDHLAARFMESGWSIKGLHRQLMTSATYRLASSHRAEHHAVDPDNRLLWRMNRRRLDVESWRDALLAASGSLDRKLGGPAINLNDGGNVRRTLYAAISRHELNGMLRLFDFPDPNLTSERRVMTTVPMQQLFVLNSDFMVRQAKQLVSRLGSASVTNDGERVEQLYRWVLARRPTADELRWGVEFLGGEAPAGAKLSRVEQYSQALLGTNEFTFVD